MSPSRKSSISPPKPIDSTHELKQRVITCLNKLSDRDTVAVAATELEFIARSLTHEFYSPFLTCIHTTDSSEKTPVRKQCVRILGFMSEVHGDALSSHLSKMISTVIRRLRDSDSAVRLACVDAVAVMSLRIATPSFSTFLKPFMDVILIEQDYNSQIGSALCLAAAIEAVKDPETTQLSKYVMRLLKLVKSESFKAKSALLSLICSIVSAGGASSRGVLDCLIPCMIEFLSSEDWAVRKAAAEVLGNVSMLDKVLVVEYGKTCLSSLESRRFDKVKIVRDAMNHTLELWKKVFGAYEDVLVLSPSQSKSSARDRDNVGYSTPVSKQSQNLAGESVQSKKAISICRSPASNVALMTDTKKRSLLKSNNRKLHTATYSKLDASPDWKAQVPMPNSSSDVGESDFKRRESNVSKSTENEEFRSLKQVSKRLLFNKTCDEKVHMFGNLKSGSRVVPICDNEYFELGAVCSNVTGEVQGDNKDIEDLDLIHKQLIQIENQQSNLLDTLQRFIGSSQSGMDSLESRVKGLEMALDEISYDLSLSSRRISDTQSKGNTCCKLPGTEFLSPNFWKRTENQNSTSRFPSFSTIGSPTYKRNMNDNDFGQRVQIENNNQYVVNTSVAICSDRRSDLDGQNRNINQAALRVNVWNGGEIDVSASPMRISNRLVS